MMEVLVKVMSHSLHNAKPKTKWRDGQIIDKRPNGYYQGIRERKTHCVIQTNDDYWTSRGSTELKSDLPAVMEFKRHLMVIHPQGSMGFSKSFSSGFKKREHKHPWDSGYAEPAEGVKFRKRDWFIDFKGLLDNAIITQAQFDSIYDKQNDHLSIILDMPLSDIVRHEDTFSRESSDYSGEFG